MASNSPNVTSNYGARVTFLGTANPGRVGCSSPTSARIRACFQRAGDLADRIIGADPELSAPEHAAARAAVERWERNASVREDAG